MEDQNLPASQPGRDRKNGSPLMLWVVLPFSLLLMVGNSRTKAGYLTRREEVLDESLQKFLVPQMSRFTISARVAYDDIKDAGDAT